MVKSVLFGFAILALLTAVTAVAEPAPEKDLTGVYACEGKNPDGSPYQGIVEILKVKDTYLVRWTVGAEKRVVGVGMVNGAVLAVSYFGGSPALVVYSVTTDGRLDGKWTIGGAEGHVFSETLTKIEEAEVPKPAKPGKRLPTSDSREATL
jgi:hypothetical protein